MQSYQILKPILSMTAVITLSVLLLWLAIRNHRPYDDKDES